MDIIINNFDTGALLMRWQVKPLRLRLNSVQHLPHHTLHTCGGAAWPYILGIHFTKLRSPALAFPPCHLCRRAPGELEG